MSKTEKLNEEQVFKQEVSDDELEAVAGGEGDSKNCTGWFVRDIYRGGFPNCAATVEDGSWCMTNDACVGTQVRYVGMENKLGKCEKAWR